MHRRAYLQTVAATLPIAVAGCSSLAEDDSAVVDETVFGDGTFRFDAEEGDTIGVDVENEAGFQTLVIIWHEDMDGNLVDMTVETETSREVTAPATTTYTAEVFAEERASVTITVE